MGPTDPSPSDSAGKSSRTWLDVCDEYLPDHLPGGGSESEIKAVLRAFSNPCPRGGPPPHPEELWPGDFSSLQRECERRFEVQALREALAREVDPGQADLFCRRLSSVDELLQRIATDKPQAEVFQVALRKRAMDMLHGSTLRAARIRALADYYYSQAGRLHHQHLQQTAPTIQERVASLVFGRVAEGIAHATLEGTSRIGPQHINILQIDPTQVQISVLDCREQVAQGIPLSEHTRGRYDAVISGGFFLYSEPDIEAPSRRYDPVGLIVCDGKLQNGPTFARAAFLVDQDGQVELRPCSLQDFELRVNKQRLPTQGMINRAQAKIGPAAPSIAIVGQRVVAVGSRLPVPLNGFVLPIPKAAAIQSGDEVCFRYLHPEQKTLAQAVAGGPMLRQQGRPSLDLQAEDFWKSAPPVTFSQDETGDTNLLARLAIGLRPDGTLVIAAIDGRNFDRALGMTLAQVGELMGHLGCDAAANMDGGSSKRMLVQGQTMDLPSTEVITADGGPARIRPVHTAIAFAARPPR